MRLYSLGARAAVLASAVVATVTCQFADALKPAGIENVVLSYASDSILVVAAPVVPSIGVTVNGRPFTGARLLLVSSDTNIVAVRADTLVPRRRGAVVLTVTLEGSTLPRNPPSIARPLVVMADAVTLDSASVRLASLGDTVTVVATARDATGSPLAGVAAAWSSSDTSVATVSPAGRVTAKGNGTATLSAAVDRDTASLPVTVAQVPTRWTFEPASLHLDALTAAATVVATAHDARGVAIAGLAPATWSVGDATILTLAGPGQVTSRLNGSTYLYAALAGGALRDSVAVTVEQHAVTVSVTPQPVPPITSVGSQIQLTARAFDRQGVELQGAETAWFTLDPGLVRVSNDGLVTALAIGTASVVASLDAGADTAAVAISNDPATVTVVPDSALATSLGDTLVFHAVARNGRGDSVAAVVEWRTPDSATVQLLADGRAIAQAVGTARVIAVVGGKADTGLAKVTNVPTAIDITPTARVYTSPGDVDTLPVTITNARGAPMPRGSVSWSSDDAAIARVTTSGVVTAIDTGHTVVRAASGAIADSVQVAVQNVPASIVIANPAVDTLTAVGQTLTLLTEVRNARGALITNYPVAWRSTARTVVDTVRPTGEATAVGYGGTLLIADASPVADTVWLAVRNPTRLYVSNAYFTGLRVGTAARPYARIADGVAAADAGDTVLVEPGVNAYSETVALARPIVLLGDSADYLAGGRNPGLLPLLAHDTGAAAITALTTAPVTVRYFAFRHTVDGPAFASDGADVKLEWLYVNPPGTVTSRIGRGVSVKNSQSGSVVKNLSVRSVRGYGISLTGSSGTLVTADTVVGVDSTGVPERGAGIAVSGGSTVTLRANVVRSTRGPRILIRGATSAEISNTTLSGRHPLVQLDSVTGLVTILSSVFQVGFDGSDAADSPDCSTDTRCAGILITDSRNGAYHGGSGRLAFTSPADIEGNTFYNANGPNSYDGTGIRVRRSMVYGNNNAFRYVATGLRLEGNSKASFSYATADTSGFLVTLQDADSVFLGGSVTHGAGVVSHYSEVPGIQPFVQISNGSFSQKTGNLVNIWDGGGETLIEDADFTSSPVNQPVVFQGSYLTLYRVRVLGVGDSVPGYRAGGDYNAGVMVLNASQLSMHATRIEGFTDFPGLTLAGSITAFSGDSNVVTRDRTGIYVHATVPASLSLQGSGNNAVFDNLTGGLKDMRAAGTGLPQWWWGDGRGPRRAADPTATGDSVLAAPVSQTSYLTAPPQTGSAAAALRAVRGTGQSAAAGATLSRAFTVRVVDAGGLPVAGVSVTFTVTAGGGNLGGPTSRVVTSNADGLAEVTLTLGPVAGANTVGASSGALAPVTFTAAGT
jgi:hypothetical protein